MAPARANWCEWTENMAFQALQLKKTSRTLKVSFGDSFFSEPPIVLVTPCFVGATEPMHVEAIETVTNITKDGAEITSDNPIDDSASGSNPLYYVNVLAIDADASWLHSLPVTVGTQIKTSNVITINVNSTAEPRPTILSPFWPDGPVGHVDAVGGALSGVNQIAVTGPNHAANYSIQYLSTELGVGGRAQCGIVNKTTSRTKAYFPDAWDTPPLVFVSPWYNTADNEFVSGIETVSLVTNNGFALSSGDCAPEFYVDWIALRASDPVHLAAISVGNAICDAIHTKARSDGNDVLQALVDDPMKVLTDYGLPAEYLAGKLLTNDYLAYLQSKAGAELGQIRERQVPRGFGACWACRIGLGVVIAGVGVAIAVGTMAEAAVIGTAILRLCRGARFSNRDCSGRQRGSHQGRRPWTDRYGHRRHLHRHSKHLLVEAAVRLRRASRAFDLKYNRSFSKSDPLTGTDSGYTRGTCRRVASSSGAPGSIVGQCAERTPVHAGPARTLSGARLVTTIRAPQVGG